MIEKNRKCPRCRRADLELKVVIGDIMTVETSCPECGLRGILYREGDPDLGEDVVSEECMRKAVEDWNEGRRE